MRTGWTITYIMTNLDGPGYFGTLPAYRHDLALVLLKHLYPATHLYPAGLSTFGYEHLRPRQELAVGAYEQGYLLADMSTAQCVENRDAPLLRRWLSLFPKSTTLVVDLHTPRSFGYALYEGDRLRRAYAGLESGITADEGPLLPEEERSFAESEIRGANRFFKKHVGPITWVLPAAAFADRLAFALMTRFLGVPFDEFYPRRLEVEYFTATRRSFLSTLLLGDK